MASKEGTFLRLSERQKLKREIFNSDQQHYKEALEENGTSTTGNCDTANRGNDDDTGCFSCGKDDDHANLLLCEACNAEYHTYCLEPPLRAVPTGDWYCSECKAKVEHSDDDGLDALVDALGPCFTSRFGEVCWAQGGAGFGWWPSFIYDPRHTIGSARELARKNIGRRHLVYFFECHDAPFSVLSSAKITEWEAGLIDDFHLGKVACGAGPKRTNTFRQALQAATVEAAKPIEMRLDWNHSELPQILPSPKLKKNPPPQLKKKRRKKVSSAKCSLSAELPFKPKPRSRPRGFPLMKETSSMMQVPTRRNLVCALEAITTIKKGCANPIVEFADDGELFVKLMQQQYIPAEGLSPGVSTSTAGERSKNVGFIKLMSRKSSTFADARRVIEEELVSDALASTLEWRFFVPDLGPVSRKQEESLGPILSFLCKATHETNLGVGTLMHPLKVFIIELKAIVCSTDIATLKTTTTSLE